MRSLTHPSSHNRAKGSKIKVLVETLSWAIGLVRQSDPCIAIKPLELNFLSPGKFCVVNRFLRKG